MACRCAGYSSKIFPAAFNSAEPLGLLSMSCSGLAAQLVKSPRGGRLQLQESGSVVWHCCSQMSFVPTRQVACEALPVSAYLSHGEILEAALGPETLSACTCTQLLAILAACLYTNKCAVAGDVHACHAAVPLTFTVCTVLLLLHFLLCMLATATGDYLKCQISAAIAGHNRPQQVNVPYQALATTAQ